jgi:hypothetical protein
MVSDYFDLGDHHWPISTDSADAQAWFDRGLVWAYAFNHEAARACFEGTVAADPDAAMGYWGLAHAVGPNYNKAWDAYDPLDLTQSLRIAVTASARAQECIDAADGASAKERALVATLTSRYPSPDPAEVRTGWCESYAQAMRQVHRRFPDDLDVLTLFAEALLNVTPWKLWDLSTGTPAAGAHTDEAKQLLESALAVPAARRHPGLLHMYLHLMEMSPQPEAALWAADWLRDLVPDGGHLQHMPTHIDVLCGDYRRVVTSNQAAVAADERYVAAEGALNFYTLYRAHNLHFLAYGAMFLGHERLALGAAKALSASLSDELLHVEAPPMADWLEGFLSVEAHVLIRFGRWADILALPLPVDPQLYCVTTATLHYAKGVAHAARGEVADAEEQRRSFTRAVARVPASRTLFNNTCVDILQVAAAMLDGELTYRRGDVDDAFAHLEENLAAATLTLTADQLAELDAPSAR